MKHEKFIIALAEQLKPQVYVELGIYQSDTFNSVVVHSTGSAYAVDIDENLGTYVTSNPKAEFYGMTTKDFHKLWLSDVRKQIDMIFIDADHSKESVISDASNFMEWLRPDYGIMILHDTWPLNRTQTAPGYSGDCYKAVPILKNRFPDCEFITIPRPYGMTLIRKPGDNWRNAKD